MMAVVDKQCNISKISALLRKASSSLRKMMIGCCGVKHEKYISKSI
jgi:hypothetical protein